MAKKKNGLVNVEEKKGNKLITIIIALLIIVLWLGLFGLFIKLDVGGFGSTVMRPLFKDVPIIKEILPDEEVEESDEYPYKSLAEAINYIKELEKEIKTLKDAGKADDETIADLEAEVQRLKAFEEEQLAFQLLKEEFYDEVVFGDEALSYEEYKRYYEEINPDYAEVLYKQVLEKYMFDMRYQELAEVYGQMDPDAAAAALYEMTGNLTDTAVAILQNMETEERAAVLEALSEIDAVFCAKLTVMLSPQ